MKEIELPPFAPVLMESTRALGYSLEAAIADLLDNSISASATKINIRFWPFDESHLTILDNGSGMSSDELTIAMRYGSVSPLNIRKENDLGRFGLGLKTASLSQCRRLTVVSKKDEKISARRWDLDFISDCKNWILLCLDENECANLPQFKELRNQKSGTLVIWNEFDRLSAGEINLEKAMNDKMTEVREHLSLVFHRYLAGEKGLKKVSISLNEDAIMPHDPFLSTLNTVYQDDERLQIKGHNVYVRSYVLPHISRLSQEQCSMIGGKTGLTRGQGFYIYRNKRLLIWGTWFRLRRRDELSKLARIRVDIPNSLDDLWTLDIRKSTAVPPEIIKKNLLRIVDKIAEGSKRTWTFRGRKETADSILHSWVRFRGRDGIIYNLNRDHPMVDVVSSKLDSEGKKQLEQLFQAIEFNLPLNSLYVDLANDERFATDGAKEIEENVKIMAVTLLNNPELNCDDQRSLYEVLKITEPFSNYRDVLEEVAKECLKNEF